ncbi:MAG: aspartate-semialdehyde dehydrogenase [Candidatus Altiarchaeales archaeon]|nr:aspartate-semialdehyde dehydrogenase [Candidatus Altiarchaeales archaeon]MBD3416029.1 aspartate-semialdehyde dehydrogenase [Candidatus Altiarchaeales archaeon]
MKKLNVGVLGATGMVGQRFIEGLEHHPYFKIACLAASDRSAGKPYREAAKWYLAGDIPKHVGDMKVELIGTGIIDEFDLDIVFSAIPSSVAKEVEGSFAEQVPVYSNTKTYRMESDVPLVVADVNPHHLDLVKVQKENRGWNGHIVTNPNCSTIGLVVPLKPILDEFGLEWVNVCTMQALSGAGYDGVPSMAAVDNVIPFIGGEEEKVELEPLKILGKMESGRVEDAGFQVFASCNRVASLDGHLKSMFIGTRDDFDIEDIVAVLQNYTSVPQELKLPTAPIPPIIVREEDDRPQPRLDRDAGRGMAVTVGRLRKKSEKKLKLTCLSHNTIRGAAGASILNAELALKEKLL